MSKCTVFITDDYQGDLATWQTLMRCPGCKAWLPRDWPIGQQFKCKSCGKTLETIPTVPEDEDEEDTDYEWGGLLCIVPDEAVKEVKQ